MYEFELTFNPHLMWINQIVVKPYFFWSSFYFSISNKNI